MNTTPVSEYDDNEIVNHSSNPHMDTILAARLSRRGALKGGIGATTAALLGGVGLSACGGSDDDTPAPAPAPTPKSLNFAAVAKTNADTVSVPAGYQVSILHALGDPMMFGDTSWSDAGTETAESYDRRIGDGHDGMYYFGLSDDGKFDANRSDRGLLCVNHEYVVAPYGLHPTGRIVTDGKRPADQVEKEIRAHGPASSKSSARAAATTWRWCVARATTAASPRPRPWTSVARLRATPSW